MAEREGRQVPREPRRRRSKEAQAPTGIDVKVSGVEMLHELLVLTKDLLHEGVGLEDDRARLLLAYEEIDSKVIDGFRSIFSVDSERLVSRFSGIVVPKFEDDVSTTDIFDSGEDLQGESLLGFIRKASRKASEAEKRKLDKTASLMMEMYPFLERDLSEKGYAVNSFEVKEEGLRIRIKKSQEPDSTEFQVGVGEEGSVIFGSAFPIDYPFDKFERTYREFGLIAASIIRALHDSTGEPLQLQSLEFAPPENLKFVLEQLKKRLKRVIHADDLVDDERIVDEIMQKISIGSIPDVRFEDIGGQQRAKEELETVAYSLTNPEAFVEEGTKPPRGILLYGPPGTGKTLLSKALASEARANIYIVRLSDVIHHLYGKSERLISAIFDQARKNSPVVILFDEIDALAAQRQYSSEATSRIVSVLLTEMDGLEEYDANVVVVGATNRLDAIDSALLRPGRFDRIVEVGLPDQEERAEIFKIKMEEAEFIAGRPLFGSDLDLDKLVSATNHFSGADIEEVLRRVLVENVKRKMRGESVSAMTTERILAEIGNYEHVRKAKSSIGFTAGRQ